MALTIKAKDEGEGSHFTSTIQWKEAFRSYWLVGAIYLLVVLFTAAYYMADTNDYANAVLAYQAGRPRDFWEFGHLLWVPLGWLLFTVFGSVTKTFVGDERTDVILIFMIVNWFAGLFSVLILRRILTEFCRQTWVVDIVTIFFIFAHAFLNFSQTGCAYIPGLSLLLLGLYILVSRYEKTETVPKTALAAGISLAGAVCLWFLYGLAIPAAVASPLLLFGWNRKMWRLAMLTGVVFGVSLSVAYIAVVVGILHITSIAGFRGWVANASHDTDITGVTRMVFGFARSFIYMGNDGIVFKRYLLHDPFNPVSLSDLFRLSVWKLLLFYGFLASITLNLMRSSGGRRVLYFLFLSCLSVIIFASFFDGAAIERYLPLYPAIFISLAFSLSDVKSVRFLKYAALSFAIAMILVDGVAMARPLLDRRQDAVTARVGDLQQRIKPHSRIILVSWQDELVNFSRSFPFNPLNRNGSLSIGALVTPGTSIVADWRRIFATETTTTWNQNGEMWVSKRVMSPRPRAEWNWVEGDDARVSWTDFYRFFSQLELGDTTGGDDGFVLVPSTARNRQLLEKELNVSGVSSAKN